MRQSQLIQESGIQQFKRELARVFDDNLHTKQWHNYVDYVIIGLIVLSTLEVFLSTYDGIVEKYGTWLKVVDYFTTFFFTMYIGALRTIAEQMSFAYEDKWNTQTFGNKLAAYLEEHKAEADKILQTPNAKKSSN